MQQLHNISTTIASRNKNNIIFAPPCAAAVVSMYVLLIKELNIHCYFSIFTATRPPVLGLRKSG